MGTNLAPILTNIYMAVLEEEMYIICKNKNITWPKMFKRFIDDGFGVIKSNKKEFLLWVNEFNCLRENILIDKWKFGNNVAFMDLHIFKGENFYNGGKLSIKVYQKPENKYMYIPYKSAHPRHTIKNYVIGELKRYVRVNTEELNFLKIKNRFFLRMRNRGFNKIKLSHWFSEVKFSSRAKFLCDNPENNCYFQGTRETEADSRLIQTSEGIMAAAIGPNTREATEEVVSEDEDTMVPFEALDNLEASFSKGSLLKRCSLSLSLQNENNKKLKTSSSYLTVLSSKKQAKERICCIFPGSMMELKPVIDNIFREEMATFVESKRMKNIFHEINVCAIVKNKKNIKNLVVKTKV